MTVGNLTQLRSLLSQLSTMSEIEQFAYVLKANASLDGSCREPSLARANHDIAQLLPTGGQSTQPSTAALRWVRWQNDEKEKGIAITFVNASSRYVVFPNGADPLSLRLLPSDTPSRDSNPKTLKLIPNRETWIKMTMEFGSDHTRWPELAYVHREALYVPPRPTEDLIRYARFLRLVKEGKVPPRPQYYRLLESSERYLVEELRTGPHTALWAVHRGMDYILGALNEHAFPFGMMSLQASANLYAAPAKILDQAPDRKDLLAPEETFGAGDPLATSLDIEIDDQRTLKTPDGREVGWARMVAGGNNGRQSDSPSGLSAATSMGRRNYQQDGFYLAHFRSNDCEGGRDVRVFVGVDGLGGAEMGEMASSAALQGAHRCIVRALRDRRLPLAEDLLDAAREALDYQTLREEMEDGISFRPGKTPDTVIAVWVVVDGVATIATAGDFLVLLCGQDAHGELNVLGHTALDSSDEHTVHNTLRSGRKHLYKVRLPERSWLVGLSDGAMGGLSPHFKRRMAQNYRQSRFDAFPDQSQFFDVLQVLEYSPPAEAGPALHDAAGGLVDVPGLETIEPERDNWTAGALYWKDKPTDSNLVLPERYGLLETVYPVHQRVHEDNPYWLRFPAPNKELFVARKMSPKGRPTLVIPDRQLRSPHIRMERVIVSENGDDRECLFVEKLVASGRVTLRDENDRLIVSLKEKGARHEVKPGQLIQLTPRTFFRVPKD